jgi:tetratricopeptide (TPR) repeat protein
MVDGKHDAENHLQRLANVQDTALGGTLDYLFGTGKKKPGSAEEVEKLLALLIQASFAPDQEAFQLYDQAYNRCGSRRVQEILDKKRARPPTDPTPAASSIPVSGTVVPPIPAEQQQAKAPSAAPILPTAMPPSPPVSNPAASKLRFCAGCGSVLDSDAKFCFDCGAPVEARDPVIPPLDQRPSVGQEIPKIQESVPPSEEPTAIPTPAKRRWPIWAGGAVTLAVIVLGYRSCTALQRQFDDAVQRGDLASASPTSAYAAREQARRGGDTAKAQEMDRKVAPLVQARSDELFNRWYKDADLGDTNWRDTMRLESWHADITASNSNRARLEFAAGQVAMLDQKFAEASQHFQSALNSQPNWPLALNGVGKACVNLKQTCDEEYYQKAIAADPNWIFPYQNLGGVYLRSGKTGEAESAYRKAVSLNPSRAGSRYLLAEMLLAKGKGARPDACSELGAALQLAGGKAQSGFNVGYAQQRFNRFCR